jgi:peroxiredoxin Q/BCP
MSAYAATLTPQAALIEGKPAPAFENIPNQDGHPRGLKDYAGKALVLYFYPKDDTPGCTTEARDFSALDQQFAKAGAVVVGVSKDSGKSHCKFRDKYSLSVELLSDENGVLCDRYGVWVEKSMYGKTYMGIERTTVLIDAKGIVRRIWPKVKVANHAQEVLEAVKSL